MPREHLQLIGLALLTAACGASDAAPDAAPDGTPPVEGCAAYEGESLDVTVKIVGDVTADGVADWAELDATAKTVTLVAGPWPGAARTALELAIAPPLFDAAAGDLDGDGQADLVVASPWASEAVVYFGPFEGGALARDDGFVIARPSEGLADRLGSNPTIADLDGDGLLDLLLTAPAEGEEACHGARDGLVYFGPLAPGVANVGDHFAADPAAGDAPDAVLKTATGSCLGDHVAVVTGPADPALVLSVVPGGVVTYALPLSPGEHDLVPRAEPFPMFDLDRDGALDGLESGVLTLSADGRRITPVFAPTDQMVQLLGLDDDPDGVLDPWLVTHDWSETFRIARLPASLDGPIDLAALTFVGTATSTSPLILASAGDVDGAGDVDLGIGRAVFRCADAGP